MGRRGQSNRGSNSRASRGGRTRGGQSARRGGGGSSNSTPMLIGGIGLVVVVAVVFMTMSDDDGDKKPKPNVDKVASAKTPAKSNLAKKKAPAKKTNPRNAPKKVYDMAKLRPLRSQVDMGPWKEIEAYFVEGYKLRKRALDARKAGNESTFKTLMTKAVDTWRKGYSESENFQYEVEGLNRDLWEACFRKEQKRIDNSLRDFRAYLNFESH